MWRKGYICALLMGMWTGAATMENSMEIPQKLKNRTIVWSESPIPYLWIYLKETKTLTGKIYMYPHVNCSIINNNKDMGITKVCMKGWGIKKIYINTMKYWSAIKKKLNLAICNSIGGTLAHFSRWNKSEREKTNTMQFHTHVDGSYCDFQGDIWFSSKYDSVNPFFSMFHVLYYILQIIWTTKKLLLKQ